MATAVTTVVIGGVLTSSASAAPDTSPPSLVSCSFSPKTVDSEGHSNQVTLQMHITDSTGVDGSIIAGANDPVTGQFTGFGWGTLTSGTIQDGVWQSVLTVKAEAAPGSWHVYVNPLADTQGNRQQDSNGCGGDLTVTYGGAGPTTTTTTSRTTTTTTSPTTTTTAAPTKPTSTAGYWFVAADGGVFNYGSAKFFGSASGATSSPVVGLAGKSDGTGYWVAEANGRVHAFGSATHYGDMSGKPLNFPIVGIAATPEGDGYYLTGRDGGIFTFGSARFLGSTGAIVLNQPIVGMTAVG